MKNVLSALNQLRGDKLEIVNKSMRYAGYKQFIWWIYNFLGKGNRKVIPSCAIWAIRNKRPSKDKKYVPFMENLDEEERVNSNIFPKK